jgi:hypothetical protein
MRHPERRHCHGHPGSWAISVTRRPRYGILSSRRGVFRDPGGPRRPSHVTFHRHQDRILQNDTLWRRPRQARSLVAPDRPPQRRSDSWVKQQRWSGARPGWLLDVRRLRGRPCAVRPWPCTSDLLGRPIEQVVLPARRLGQSRCSSARPRSLLLRRIARQQRSVARLGSVQDTSRNHVRLTAGKVPRQRSGARKRSFDAFSDYLLYG